MKEQFSKLLAHFSAIAARSPARPNQSGNRFQDLLAGFLGRQARVTKVERGTAADQKMAFRELLGGHAEAISRYRAYQEDVAEDFNMLAVMNLIGKEIRHSMVLAWLLDHDLWKLGTHAQGSLGFRLFLAEFKLPADYAEGKYMVKREVAGNESVVDIEISARSRFLIHIENKIWSAEGVRQSEREWADLLRRTSNLDIPSGHVHAFFLTPEGRAASVKEFTAISWGRVARVFEEFAIQAKPPDVRLFTAHYARGIRRFIATQDTAEVNHVHTTDERSRDLPPGALG